MMIEQMIKSFDQLSAQEQDNLLEILRQRRSQLTEGEILANDSQLTTHSAEDEEPQQETFWEMTLRFRQRMDAEGIEFNDDDFANLRDKSPGREVEL